MTIPAIFHIYWAHKGAAGVIACPAWLLICQDIPSALPPGGVGTIYGMMAMAILFLVREVKEERSKTAALHDKLEDALKEWRESESERLNKHIKNKETNE